MFYFRVDANSVIGTGHVMRCLSIAYALKMRGIDSTFITADEESEHFISTYDYPVICLGSKWDDLNGEIEKITRIIIKYKINQLLVDTYFVTEVYFLNIKKHTRILYIDDRDEFIYPVDILINYNIYAHSLNYDKNYDKKVKLLLGSSYTPLREEFQNNTRIIKEKVSDILITSGGTDNLNITVKILEYLMELKEYKALKFHVIIGKFNRNKEELLKQTHNCDNISLYRNVNQISKLMLSCDIALTAGGTTLYEICACGLPAISYAIADNQLQSVKEFDNKDIIYYAGDARENIEFLVNRMKYRLEILIQNYELRRNISTRMRSYIDGYGAQRIIDEII